MTIRRLRHLQPLAQLNAALWISVFAGTSAYAAGPQPSSNQPAVLVHYMPWFESKEVSGHWGWHWTMNHFDPEQMDDRQRRSIASHFYPLIGPYDSDDPDVVEYHLLLMRVAGIDGVVVDWYGTDDVDDYARNHRCAARLIELARRRNVQFAICYEQRIFKTLVQKGAARPETVVGHGQAHLRFCQKQWFSDPLYVKLQNRPLLLMFGHDDLTPPQMSQLLSKLKPRPLLLTTDKRDEPADGSFAWPPMWRSKDGVLSLQDLLAYYQQLYRQTDVKIAAAMPGFHDIYAQAGVHASWGFLDSRAGETFGRTLDLAMDAKRPWIQLVTWNDFGEGTSIEPARDYEYRYLETLQRVRRERIDKNFAFTADDLRLPLRIFTLRKQPLATGQRQRLDRAVDLLFAGKASQAAAAIAELDGGG
jgi:hypothetical protein